MTKSYDVIVVGARCAGSPTAMLLARAGYQVLLVDRVTFPSDTVSTHLLHPPGADALDRWGLLDRLVATGCPPISTYTFDLGPIALIGSPGTAYAPRRTVLDHLLVGAADEAGVEVREGFTLEALVSDDDGRVVGIRGHGRGGATVTEGATVVVGADGKHSRVAAAVAAPAYAETPAAEGVYYAYWSGVDTDGFEVYIRPDRAVAAFPTHDDLTLVLTAWPISECDANRGDVEGNYLKTLELAPTVADRVAAARRETQFRGTSDLPGFFRRPYGPGWALVGDAGHTVDPCTAQGISHGFGDAERLAAALDAVLSGRGTFDETMSSYQKERDQAVMPMYDLTCKLATLEPPPPEMQQLLGAASTQPGASTEFVKMMAGVLPVPAFFAPDHVAAIMQGVGPSGRAHSAER